MSVKFKFENIIFSDTYQKLFITFFCWSILDSTDHNMQFFGFLLSGLPPPPLLVVRPLKKTLLMCGAFSIQKYILSTWPFSLEIMELIRRGSFKSSGSFRPHYPFQVKRVISGHRINCKLVESLSIGVFKGGFGSELYLLLVLFFNLYPNLTDLQMLGNSFWEFGLVSTYQRFRAAFWPKSAPFWK